MSTSTEMTSALHIHSLCLERTFVLCQKRKHSNELAKTSEKESHLQPRRANLSGKKWSTFARGEHGASSAKQAIAFGLSKARRAVDEVPINKHSSLSIMRQSTTDPT